MRSATYTPEFRAEAVKLVLGKRVAVGTQLSNTSRAAHASVPAILTIARRLA